MFATCAESVASHSCGSISPPASRTRAIVSVIASGVLSAANTFAPSCAKITAMARPLPQPGPTHPAPLTIATFPCSLPAMSFPGLLFPAPLLLITVPWRRRETKPDDAGRKFREDRTMRQQAGALALVGALTVAAPAQAADFKVGISE